MPVDVVDVACTACGCVCDDLRITVEENRIVRIDPKCPLAERWFLQETTATSLATSAGQSLAPDPMTEAARLLSQARSPLIYGLSGSSTEGQRAAIRLAEFLRATIDTSASTCHGPSILALQQVGESTCSLGEISNRADFVMYWGSDPVVSHPRHMERYAFEPRGQFTPGGREGRTLAVADVVRTATTDRAELLLIVDKGADFDVLWTLRSLLIGRRPQIPQVGGVPVTQLERLVERMKAARCGVFFFGRGLTSGATGHLNVQSLLLLVRDLNAFTRFHARRMRVYGDVAGADSVLCWQTGFPFSVSLSRGYPRYKRAHQL